LYMDLLPGQIKELGRVFISRLDAPKSVKAFLPEIENKNMPNPFTGYNKQLYYTDPLLIQVFKIHDDRVEKYIFFDFGKDAPSKSDIESLLSRKPRTFQGYSKVFQLENVYETPDFVVATIILSPNGYSILFDKKSNKSIAWESDKINWVSDKNAKYEAYQFFPVKISAVYDDYFCMILNANGISNSKARLIKGNVVLSPNHPDYKNYDLVMKTDIMDNPVIALYKFKNLK
jgi:hypothetical protein